jgi:hypothetical protein
MTKIDTNALDLKKEPELQLSDLNSKVVAAVAAKALQNMQASPLDFSPVGLAAKTTLLISDALKPLQAVLDLGMVLGPDVRERMIVEIAKSLGIKIAPEELTLHCVGQPTVTISLTLPELSQLWSLSTPRAVYYHPETRRWEFEAHYLDHVRTALSGIRGTPLTQ